MKRKYEPHHEITCFILCHMQTTKTHSRCICAVCSEPLLSSVKYTLNYTAKLSRLAVPALWLLPLPELNRRGLPLYEGESITRGHTLKQRHADAERRCKIDTTLKQCCINVDGHRH